jgi:hypothetical protein
MKRLSVISYVSKMFKEVYRELFDTFADAQKRDQWSAEKYKKEHKGDLENWRYELASCTSSLACLDLSGPENRYSRILSLLPSLTRATLSLGG